MKNKVAIITGSTKGIGLGIAEEFAKEKATVIIASLNQKDCEKTAKKIASKYKVKTLGIACDVSDTNQIRNLIKTTKNKFKKIDIFVNNAGIYPFKSISQIEEKDWDLVLDTNLKGSFFAIKEASKIMKPGSKILMISSIASMIGFSGLSHYCASKGGMNALVRSAALELASKKININAIAPGGIDTPGTKGSMDAKAREQIAARIPWKRRGTPKDIATVATFLCSDKAEYITGQILVVDGGWTLG